MSSKTNLFFNITQTNKPQEKGIGQAIIRSGVNAAMNNSGVMRHGLNTIYYANHNRPIMAVREGAATIYDAVTGIRR